ncbi:MAG TPA: hypothetical protein GX714_02015, partial [Chloroflexi bacterium]|nr:hypothetical protein [Chloroflexota bacterium]
AAIARDADALRTEAQQRADAWRQAADARFDRVVEYVVRLVTLAEEG